MQATILSPLYFCPMGKAICMLVRPLLRQKPCLGRFTFRGGGLKARKRYVAPYSPPSEPPPPYSTDRGGGGEVKIVQCPTHCPTHCLQMFVLNLPTSKVHISLQKLLKIDDKAKDKIM